LALHKLHGDLKVPVPWPEEFSPAQPALLFQVKPALYFYKKGFFSTKAKNAKIALLKEKGKKLVDKLVKRPEEPKIKPIILEAGEILVKGPPKEVEERKEFIPPEMKLTPGEREIVEAIEKKISKPYFQTAIKVLYLGKGDAYFVPNASIPMGFLNSFLTLNLNRFSPIGKTKTKVQVLKGPRVYARKKKIFWLYRLRLPPIFLPEAPIISDYWRVKGGTSILNIEEMASLFHFPSRIVAPAPTMERIEAKKGEPPPELPIE